MYQSGPSRQTTATSPAPPAATSDVVILDVIMPGLSGPRLLSELRKRLPRAPVLLISGYSQSTEVQEMLSAGASELIQKPFRLDDLAAAIRRVLEAATHAHKRTSS